MTAVNESNTSIQPGISRKLVAWGLVVWFGVAVFIRLTGHVLLNPNQPLVLAGFFALVIPLMVLVTYPIYRVFNVERSAGRLLQA